MIISPEEFIQLRTSNSEKDQRRAATDNASNSVWFEIIRQYPEFKVWVVLNKTIPIEILEILSKDKTTEVREAVARKRKINDKIFRLLSHDQSENVRYALLCNTKIDKELKKQINVKDSDWLKRTLEEQLLK